MNAPRTESNSKSKGNYSERFIRWQKITIEERGKVISLLLTLALATVAFVFNRLIEHSLKDGSKCLVFVGMCFLLVCIIIAVFVTLNRLKDFRETTAIIKAKRDGVQKAIIEGMEKENDDTSKLTLRCIGWMVWTFGIGEGFTIIGLIIEFADKFFNYLPINDMEIKDSITVASAAILAIGWFVNAHLNRKNEIAKKRLEYRLPTLKSFLKIWYFVQQSVGKESIDTVEYKKLITEVREDFQLYGQKDEIELFEEFVQFGLGKDYDRDKAVEALEKLVQLVRKRIRIELDIK